MTKRASIKPRKTRSSKVRKTVQARRSPILSDDVSKLTYLAYTKEIDRVEPEEIALVLGQLQSKRARDVANALFGQGRTTSKARQTARRIIDVVNRRVAHA
jgi:hypothetical protein